jgi:hypothetical protein
VKNSGDKAIAKFDSHNIFALFNTLELLIGPLYWLTPSSTRGVIWRLFCVSLQKKRKIMESVGAVG